MKIVMQKIIKYIIKPAIFLSIIIGLTECDFPLPEEGSIPDTTPPSASFSYKPQGSNYLAIDFINSSNSASDYLWDFGDGTTSTAVSPTHIFAADGAYTVTLTASDKLEKSDTKSEELTIVKAFSPTIVNPSFEAADRSPWAYGSSLTSTYSGSGSPVPPDGVSAAKLSSTAQFCRQAITVEANKKYTVSFYYVTQPGFHGRVIINKDAGANTIGTEIIRKDLATTPNSTQYVQEQITFLSGTSTSIVIRLEYVDGELRYDNVTIREEI